MDIETTISYLESRVRDAVLAKKMPPDTVLLLDELVLSHRSLEARLATAMTMLAQPDQEETAIMTQEAVIPSSACSLEMWTDGACSGNPGPGGWAVIVQEPGGERFIVGGEPGTTNNRMELCAMIEALSVSREVPQVIIHSDSEYVLKGMKEWLPGWKARGWRNAAGKEVVNRDLWERIDGLISARAQAGLPPVSGRHVRGHSGDPQNERCDVLAVQARNEASSSGKTFLREMAAAVGAAPSL